MCWWNRPDSQFVATMEEGRERVYFSYHVAKDAIANDYQDAGHEEDGKKPGRKVPGKEGSPKGKMESPKRCGVFCAQREIIEAEHDPLVPIGHVLSPGRCGI